MTDRRRLAAEPAGASLDERLERVAQRAAARGPRSRAHERARAHRTRGARGRRRRSRDRRRAGRASAAPRPRSCGPRGCSKAGPTAVAADRASSRSARDAETLRAPIDAARRAARGARRRGRRARSGARRVARRRRTMTQTRGRASSEIADRLAGDVGAFKVALAAEQKLERPACRARRRPTTLLAAADAELADLDVRRSELPAAARGAERGASPRPLFGRPRRPEAATRVAEAPRPARGRAARRTLAAPRSSRRRRASSPQDGRSRARPPNSTGCASGASAIMPASSPSC